MIPPSSYAFRRTEFHPHLLSYRPDIDGLRAVAVLAVVVYHAFPSLMKGGFIGVDIFFVISGYLISSILLAQIKSGDFSILQFYQRRIARIFPALVLVLISCLAFGWIALLPDEYKALALHVVSGSLFVSNLTLWSESSYFDVAAEMKPLLHLWSLGVEEQFYILWPIFIYYCARRNIVGCIAAAAIFSFGFNVFQSFYHPVADFYSPLTRFWELQAGALLACTGPRTRLPSAAANVISICGALSIAVGLFIVDAGRPYPGVLGLVPVFGAVAIIAAGKDAFFNRAMLSNAPIVYLGLISYPVYLWHWPLLSFARIVESSNPSVSARLLAVASSIVLGFLTHKLIEKPLRNAPICKKTTSIMLAVSLGLVACFAGFVYVKQGIPSRTGANPVVLYPGDLGRDPYLTYIGKNFSRCMDVKLRELSVLDAGYGYRCFQSKPGSSIEVLLLGDSHAEHLLPGLAEQLKGINVGSLIQPGLPSEDSDLFKNVIPAVANDQSIKVVVISAMWSDKINRFMTAPEIGIHKMIKAFTERGKRVYILDDIPAYPYSPEKCMYGRRLSTGTERCGMTIDEYNAQRVGWIGAVQRALVGEPAAHFVSVSHLLCTFAACSMVMDNELLYRDSNHLSVVGSKMLMEKLMQGGFHFGY